MIEVIEQNVTKQPDICIESCKSLIEGVSKTILKALDPTVTDDDLKNLDVMPLFKKAAKKLAEFDEEIEPDFINRSGTLVENFGMLRNQRGDISHGKAAPKQYMSSPQFSGLVAQITEALAYYILDHFFRIDFSYSEEVKYEDNPDFNQSLDDLNPFEGLSFSKALFDQDNVSYFEQLLEYQTEQEEETPILDIEELDD
ncbi:MAG: abortive infection family protein [Pyrinomonadaceae bacterium]